MKRSLIYFALLYSEATTAVFLIALIAYWVAQPSGIKTCGRWGLTSAACGATLSSAVLVLTGMATFSLFRRLRNEKNTKSDSE